MITGEYVRSSGLLGLQRVVEEAGGRFESMLTRVGFTLEDVGTVDKLISFRSCSTLLETISNETGVPDIGVRLALANHPHFPNLGPVLLLARFCRSVREWESIARDYWDYHSNCMILELVEGAPQGQTVLRYAFKGLGIELRQQTEHIVATLIGLIRAISGHPELKPLGVSVRHQRLNECKSLDVFADCPVEYGAEFTEIAFDSGVLDYPTRGDLTYFRGILRTCIQVRLNQMSFQDCSASVHVRLAVASLLGTGKSDIQSVSELLGVPVKSLQRELSDEGMTYSNILDDVRQQMAMDMLHHSKAPIANIARLLGYSSPTAFTLAFKRWTGESPLACRKASSG